MADLSQQRPEQLVRTSMETHRRTLAVGIDKTTHVARVVRVNGDGLKERLAFNSSPEALARAAEIGCEDWVRVSMWTACWLAWI